MAISTKKVLHDKKTEKGLAEILTKLGGEPSSTDCTCDLIDKIGDALEGGLPSGGSEVVYEFLKDELETTTYDDANKWVGLTNTETIQKFRNMAEQTIDKSIKKTELFVFDAQKGIHLKFNFNNIVYFNGRNESNDLLSAYINVGVALNGAENVETLQIQILADSVFVQGSITAITYFVAGQKLKFYFE